MLSGSYFMFILASSVSLGSFISIPADHSLHHALHHFEVLHKHHLEHRHIVKRRRLIVLQTLNREFQLNLQPRQGGGILLPGAGIISIGTNGMRTHHAIDPTHFLTGQVAGDEASRVWAHLDGTGILTASISTSDDHYFIEPSHRHFKQSHDFHMISYRGSDLKFNTTSNGSSYCGVGTISSLLPQPHSSHPSLSSPEGLRVLRQTTPLSKNSCPMHLVATHRFHQAYGRSGDVESTILFMAQILDDVDHHIFRTVMWDQDIVKFGLAIKNITVYESMREGPRYNMMGTGGTAGQMLRLFSHHDWSDFCLAHLFAFQQFVDGRVGVAYPASSEDHPGGICSRARNNFNGGSIATPNVGLSSLYGEGGRDLLFAEARLIVAHEIGHNWGSGHDPTRSTGPCNPILSDQAGKFLMFPSKTDGTQFNNDKFSNCSREMISMVLRRKSPSCFIKRGENTCGNYEIEADEECDAGLQGMLGKDPCCDSDCHLKPGKNCSDINHICCTNCFLSSTTKICRSFPPNNSQCYDNVRCDGMRKTCPKNPPTLEVNSSCHALGKCLPNGTICQSDGSCSFPPPTDYRSTVQCYDFCRLQNLERCFCSGSQNECKFCCRDPSPNMTTPPCQLARPETLLPDGMTCLGGLCQGGTCMPRTQDLISRLYTLFNNINIDKLFMFAAENIVGSVLFFTTFFYVIIGVAIHCYDRWHFRRVRKTVTKIDEERFVNYDEDNQDSALLSLDLAKPEVDSSKARRGLVRMGSRIAAQQYSRKSVSYSKDMEVHGRKLSQVLEQSRNMDPQSDNIMHMIFPSKHKQSES